MSTPEHLEIAVASEEESIKEKGELEAIQTWNEISDIAFEEVDFEEEEDEEDEEEEEEEEDEEDEEDEDNAYGIYDYLGIYEEEEDEKPDLSEYEVSLDQNGIGYVIHEQEVNFY